VITVTDIFAGAGGSTTGMAQVDGVIVDLFAGPGGWDEGLRMIGRTDVVGVEWDESACRTAEAAGHKRVRADVSALEPLDFVRGAALCDLLGISVADAIATHRCPSLPIASPPCQAWSFAGKRGGEAGRARCETVRPGPGRAAGGQPVRRSGHRARSMGGWPAHRPAAVLTAC
jgi:site-specific DNA-cytosine methylase